MMLTIKARTCRRLGAILAAPRFRNRRRLALALRMKRSRTEVTSEAIIRKSVTIKRSGQFSKLDVRAATSRRRLAVATS